MLTLISTAKMGRDLSGLGPVRSSTRSASSPSRSIPPRSTLHDGLFNRLTSSIAARRLEGGETCSCLGRNSSARSGAITRSRKAEGDSEGVDDKDNEGLVISVTLRRRSTLPSREADGGPE